MDLFSLTCGVNESFAFAAGSLQKYIQFGSKTRLAEHVIATGNCFYQLKNAHEAEIKRQGDFEQVVRNNRIEAEQRLAAILCTHAEDKSLTPFDFVDGAYETRNVSVAKMIADVAARFDQVARFQAVLANKLREVREESGVKLASHRDEIDALNVLVASRDMDIVRLKDCARATENSLKVELEKAESARRTAECDVGNLKHQVEHLQKELLAAADRIHGQSEALSAAASKQPTA